MQDSSRSWGKAEYDVSKGLNLGALDKIERVVLQFGELMISVRCRDPSEGEGTVEVRLPGHTLSLSHSDIGMEV